MKPEVILDHDRRVCVLTTFNSAVALPVGMARDVERRVNRDIPEHYHDEIYNHTIIDQKEGDKRGYQIVIKVSFSKNDISVRSALAYAEDVARLYIAEYSKYEDLMRFLDLNRKYFER